MTCAPVPGIEAATQLKTVMLIFNPKWDMHWLRTKQNREWFASKTCSQNSGFSFGSF